MSQVSISDSMSLHNERKRRLSSIMSETVSVLKILNMDDAVDKLVALKRKLDDSAFRVMIVGTFKNGKSTFINAMLGQDVLPAYITPATAVISEVKYDDTQKAMLYFADPMPKPKELHSSIPNEIKSYIRQYHGKNIPPMQIDCNSIEDYATIPEDVEEPEELLLASPYSKVELFWPLDILKNGVELIDSPGLNEASTRTAVTMNYLPSVDAILFILAADKLCSEDEMEALSNELSSFKDSTFFVVNRFDLVSSSRERDRVTKFANLKLSPFTSRKIYFISALQALKAKERHDTNSLNESGFVGFEKDLTDFLINDRGKIKFVQPLKAVKDLINTKARQVIKNKQSMLDVGLQELEKRCKQIEPELANARDKRTQMELKFSNQCMSSERILGKAVRDACNKLKGQISVWVKEYKPKDRGLLKSTFSPNQVSKEIAEEISDYINRKSIQFFNKWREDSFGPLVLEQMAQMVSNCDRDLTSFYNSLDQINVKLTGHSDSSRANVSGWDRIKGAAVGVLAMDPCLIVSGSTHGLSSEMLKTFGLEVGGFSLLMLTGLLNPITMVGVIGAAIARTLFTNSSGIVDRVKQTVIDGTNDHITQEESSIVERTVESAIKYMNDKLIEPTLQCLDAEINGLKNQIDDILIEKRRGEQNVAQERQALEQCAKKLTSIDQELDSMSYELLGA